MEVELFCIRVGQTYIDQNISSCDLSNAKKYLNEKDAINLIVENKDLLDNVAVVVKLLCSYNIEECKLQNKRKNNGVNVFYDLMSRKPPALCWWMN